jgi:hypothetical protein
MNKSSKTKIITELQRANDMCRTIMLRKQSRMKIDETKMSELFDFRDVDWEDLFKADNLFLNHEYYLEIIAVTKDPKVNRLRHLQLNGKIESRLKSLQLLLENELSDDNVQVYTECIDNLQEITPKFSQEPWTSYFYLGLSISEPNVSQKNLLAQAISKWLYLNIDFKPFQELRFKLQRFEYLPPRVHDHILRTKLGRNYDAFPFFFVRRKMSMSEIYHEKI